MSRRLFIAISFFLSILITILIPAGAIEKSKAVDIIITLFSVFAGIMIALLTVITDPSHYQNWKEQINDRDRIKKVIIRQTVLFYGYLTTLGLIILSYLFEYFPQEILIYKVYVQKSYLFIGFFSFLLSFSLPSVMSSSYLKKFDKITDKKIKNK